MIKSFRSEEAEKLFHRERSRRLPSEIQRTTMRKLWMIDAAVNLADLRIPPANHLEALRGNRNGQCSIRINRQWRICFRWKDGDAFDVDIVDYHS